MVSHISFFDPFIQLIWTWPLYTPSPLASSFALVIITMVVRGHVTIKPNYGSFKAAGTNDLWAHFLQEDTVSVTIASHVVMTVLFVHVFSHLN